VSARRLARRSLVCRTAALLIAATIANVRVEWIDKDFVQRAARC
jgi:hypothetical protein